MKKTYEKLSEEFASMHRQFDRQDDFETAYAIRTIGKPWYTKEQWEDRLEMRRRARRIGTILHWAQKRVRKQGYQWPLNMDFGDPCGKFNDLMWRIKTKDLISSPATQQDLLPPRQASTAPAAPG